ncbi:hypothetical protein K3495_g13430 [Podosphaera aphanis]|nr:hypothetical protein K3495_g13430 [Podosphaera aphanis]
MGGINTLQILKAAVAALSTGQTKAIDDRPRAKWRSAADFEQLAKEGRCIRCQKKGHKSRSCPTYRAAKKPTNISYLQSSTIATVESPTASMEKDDFESESSMSGED